MADHISLPVQPRDERGKHVHAVRRDGRVPAILYGHRLQATPLTADVKALERVWHRAGRSHLVDLQVEGGRTHRVLIRDYQIHPRTGHPLHVDFFAVNLREKITVEVPVVLVGDAPAVTETKEGMLQQAITHVRIECLPDRLPAQISVDVSGLREVGDHLTLGQLQLPEGVSLLQTADPDEQVVKVAPLRLREEVEAAPAAEEAVPAAATAGEGEESA